MQGEEMDGNGAFDPEARVARLTERVDNQGLRITHLETVVTKGFADMQSVFGKQFADLNSDLRNKDRTPWPVIWSAMGVCFAVLFGIGGALYYPVRETMAETKADVRQLKDMTLSVGSFIDFKTTYENNRVISRNEYTDKFNNLNRDIDALRDSQVPRKEVERILQSYDVQILGLQRQVDEIKRENAQTWTPRDVLQEHQKSIDRLEQLIRRAPKEPSDDQ